MVGVPEAPERVTVEVPAVNVPLFVRRGPEVPESVTVETFAVNVPPASISSVPVEKAMLLDVVLRFAVALPVG